MRRRSYFGSGNPKWKGGKMLIGGYLYILSPHHPNKTQKGYVCEHRLVVEKRLGRLLLRSEVVHHKNGIITDNRFQNLELISSPGKHFIKEHLGSRDKKGRFQLCQLSK